VCFVCLCMRVFACACVHAPVRARACICVFLRVVCVFESVPFFVPRTSCVSVSDGF
jgi:hypothetical protein